MDCSDDGSADGEWYDIVRRSDGSVMFSFTDTQRHLIYRENGIISMRPVLDEECVFAMNTIVQVMINHGYRVIPPF